MSTNSDIRSRVEAWLSGRVPSWDADKQAAMLRPVCEWRDAVEQWGADSGAARGCLLDLVREAWGQPTLQPFFYQRIGFEGERPYRPEMWSVCPRDSDGHYEGPSEFACLVTALEAAP